MSKFANVYTGPNGTFYTIHTVLHTHRDIAISYPFDSHYAQLPRLQSRDEIIVWILCLETIARLV